MNIVHHTSKTIELSDSRDIRNVYRVCSDVVDTLAGRVNGVRSASTISGIDGLVGRQGVSVGAQSQRRDDSVVAIITVEHDTRYLGDTLHAVLTQTIVPGNIIIAQCNDSSTHSSHGRGGHEGVADGGFERIFGALHELLGVRASVVQVQAHSFGQAVDEALNAGQITSQTEYLWLLHDDSRPLTDDYVEKMDEVRRNNSYVSVIGGKQLSWDGQVLHNVGYFARNPHGITSLVVDGEIDQEQYDSRQDMYAVSMAGAFVKLSEWMRLGGLHAGVGTFGQSRDYSRRVVRSGGRVIVVPEAQIGHRRARYEGCRTPGGDVHELNPLDIRTAHNSTMSQFFARDAYSYSDSPVMTWLPMWLCHIVLSLVRFISLCIRKKPYEALCELVSPWVILARMGTVLSMRSCLTRVHKVSLSSLKSLVATREDVRRYYGHIRDIVDQNNRTIVSPLVKQHLRTQSRIRHTWLLVGAVVALCAHIVVHFGTVRGLLTGAYLGSGSMLSTASSVRSLFEAATTGYSFAWGQGLSVPPSPFLLVYAVVSLLTGGNAWGTASIIFVISVPAAFTAMWALVGIFTRSNLSRVVLASLWVVFGVFVGVWSMGHLPMMIVLIFLPAGMAFAGKALGVYQSEEPIESAPSVQAAAWAALCFGVVSASEPQLFVIFVMALLPMLIIFRDHIWMLISMLIPSTVALAPTLVYVARHPQTYVQLFADVVTRSLGTMSLDASGQSTVLSVGSVIPQNSALSTIVSALTVSPLAATNSADSVGFAWAVIFTGVIVCSLIVCVAVLVACLLLPTAMKVSRAIWVFVIAAFVGLAFVPQIPVSVSSGQFVYAQALPVVTLLVGCMACGLAILSGPARASFQSLIDISSVSEGVVGDTETSASVTIEGSDIKNSRFVFALCRCFVVLISAALMAGWIFGAYSAHGQSGNSTTLVRASTDELPMVVQDYVNSGLRRRILAISARDESHVDYTVMRSAHGDIIDRSVAVDALKVAVAASNDGNARSVISSANDREAKVAQALSRLMVHSSDEAIATLSDAGFGGVYVAHDGQGFDDNIIAHFIATNSAEVVVRQESGTYIRIALKSVNDQGIDLDGWNREYASPLRYAWLGVMILVGIVYLLIAVPRPFSSTRIVARH